VNYQTQQQREAEEAQKKQQQAQQVNARLLLDEMNKYAKAKLGEVPRSEMPQVCACDAEESDDIPTGKLEFISPDKLKKTQEKINRTKAQGIANDWANAGKKPVLISRDNWILDGHHRVEAAKTLGKLVRVVRVDLPGRKALTKLQELEEEIDS
jgi:transcription initiation factor TFIID subunit TAF12